VWRRAAESNRAHEFCRLVCSPELRVRICGAFSPGFPSMARSRGFAGWTWHRTKGVA